MKLKKKMREWDFSSKKNISIEISAALCLIVRAAFF